MTLEELTVEATAEIEAAKPLFKQVNNERLEFTDDDYAQAVTDLANNKFNEQEFGYIQARQEEYPSYGEQLDYIFHNGLDAWKTDIIQPIKDNNPKPE
jgi:hypothetical protein